MVATMSKEFWLSRISPTFDEAAYVSCLFSSYIFSFIYYWKLMGIKSEWIKNLYMVVVATIFLFLCFSLSSIMLVYFSIFFTYFITKWFRGRKWMPLANFVACLVLLSVVHLYRQFGPGANVDEYVPDITGPLMMLVIKLTSFAFDMRDSWVWTSKPAKSPASDNPTVIITRAPASDKQTKMPLVDMDTKFSVLRKYPSMLEFLGYSLLFPGILTGPTISFYEYRTFINGTYFTGVNLTHGALSGRKRRASYLFIASIISMIIYQGLKNYIYPAFTLEPEFISRPTWQRILYVLLCAFIIRTRYYFIWMVAEGSYVIIGLGFRLGATGKPLWDRLENINPLRIESYTDFKLLISQWNSCTNRWLQTYVYRRIQNYYGKTTSSSRASIATYFVSALWHGFYPGYYITFIGAAWMTIISRLLYKNAPWLFGGFRRKFIMFIPMHIIVEFTIFPFCLLDFKRSLQFYKSFGFFSYFFFAIVTIYFVLIPKLKKKVKTRPSLLASPPPPPSMQPPSPKQE